MDFASTREAIKIIGGRGPMESLGGVALQGIENIVKTGVGVVSIVALTRSAPACDTGMDFI